MSADSRVHQGENPEVLSSSRRAMKRWVEIIFPLLAAGFLLVGLAHMIQPARADTTALSVGLIADGSSFDDQGFNWSAYQGLLRVQSELGLVTHAYTVTNSNEYAARLQKCVSDGNGLCITVGFPFGDSTKAAAIAHSDVKFATIDYSWDSYPTNLRGIQFDSNEVGYLAGVLAARMTASDKIGAIGGMDISPVNAFIDGYVQGAQCANPSITVFTNYINSFTDQALGAQAASNQIAQGAQVIFQVAGPAGTGALVYTTQSGYWAIGVDVDQYLTVFNNGTVPGHDKLLTSAMKEVGYSVYQTAYDVLYSQFTSGTVKYGLKEGGVGMAPYHTAGASISPATQAEIERFKFGLIGGLIKPDASCTTEWLYLPMLQR